MYIGHLAPHIHVRCYTPHTRPIRNRTRHEKKSKMQLQKSLRALPSSSAFLFSHRMMTRDTRHGHALSYGTYGSRYGFTHADSQTVTHRLRHLMHQSPSVCVQQNTKAIQRANRGVEEDGPECRPRRSGRHGPRDAPMGHRAGMGPRKPLGWCAPLPCGRASHCKGAVCSHTRHARQVLSGEQLPQAVEA